MSRVVLTTVGTSLKGNAERAKREPAALLRDDPRAACAEANVLDRLELIGGSDCVELFHSETPDGQKCAEEIAVWLTVRRIKVTLTPIPGLTYQTKDFHRGLRSLVRLLAQRIRTTRRQNDTPVLNALGGFKSEVAYATLVGALFGIPNVYIHQGFEELLSVPPLPIGWDVARIDAFADTLEWLDAEARTEVEARSRLLALPDDLRETLTEPGDDGYRYLSPLGEACFEAYKARIEEPTGDPILLSKKAQRDYEAMEPSVRSAFDSVLRKLSKPEFRHKNSKTLEQSQGDARVYPQGRRDERLFWIEDDEGTVKVLELARHEKGYEELYSKGVRSKNYGGWQPWPSFVGS
ncbi:putative CRISPR-associated protein [Armatimonas sp.]|uniref:putative CRISPR-associated protein n=1 Tax=Armatimonas sp. TaxID=1872638 RepID=UPI003750CBBA